MESGKLGPMSRRRAKTKSEPEELSQDQLGFAILDMAEAIRNAGVEAYTCFYYHREFYNFFAERPNLLAVARGWVNSTVEVYLRMGIIAMCKIVDGDKNAATLQNLFKLDNKLQNQITDEDSSTIKYRELLNDLKAMMKHDSFKEARVLRNRRYAHTDIDYLKEPFPDMVHSDFRKFLVKMAKMVDLCKPPGQSHVENWSIPGSEDCLKMFRLLEVGLDGQRMMEDESFARLIGKPIKLGDWRDERPDPRANEMQACREKWDSFSL